jgi:uncharacterized protein YndB with AHSA1/START domain
VKLHRVFKAPAERVYRAFLNPEALAQWLPPYGFTCKVHSLDPKVGGLFKMSFTNFSSDKSHSFGGKFIELIPHQLIKYTDRFDDPNLPGEILVTVHLKSVICGSEITVLQENIPAAIPVEFCYLGWQESLDKLSRLVDPEIKDG